MNAWVGTVGNLIVGRFGRLRDIKAEQERIGRRIRKWTRDLPVKWKRPEPLTEACVNCGDAYAKGEGFPDHDGGRWECCCSQECFSELCGAEPDEEMVYIPFPTTGT